jgi:hypothetical protein
MEQRGINEHFENGSLQSRGVEKVTPYLQVWTPIVRYCIEWKRVDKIAQM